MVEASHARGWGVRACGIELADANCSVRLHSARLISGAQTHRTMEPVGGWRRVSTLGIDRERFRAAGRVSLADLSVSTSSSILDRICQHHLCRKWRRDAAAGLVGCEHVH